MAQPEKQHFSCLGQSRSCRQSSSSVHGSDVSCSLTFGHCPGLSEKRERRGSRATGSPAGTELQAWQSWHLRATLVASYVPSVHPAVAVPSTSCKRLSTEPSCVRHCRHSPILLPHLALGPCRRDRIDCCSTSHLLGTVRLLHRGPGTGIPLPARSGGRSLVSLEGRRCAAGDGWASPQMPWGGCSVAPTLGRAQAHVVTAPQATLLLTRAVGVTPAPLSAVVAGEQPSTGRAESILPCRSWCGVKWVPLQCSSPMGTQPSAQGALPDPSLHPSVLGPPILQGDPPSIIPLLPAALAAPRLAALLLVWLQLAGAGLAELNYRAELGWWGHWVGGESGMDQLQGVFSVPTTSLLLCALLPTQPLSACGGCCGHPLSPGRGPACNPRPTPSHPVSRAGAAGRHWRPQLLLQHFSALGQSLSPSHSSRHGPSSSGSATGHSPVLGFSGGAERSEAALSTAGDRGTSRCPRHPELRALTVAQARPAARCPRPEAVGVAPAAAVGERLAAPGGDIVEEAQLVAAAGPRRGGEMADVCSTALSAPRSRGCPRARGSSGTRRPYPAPAPRRLHRSPAGSTSGCPGSLCPPDTERSRGKRAPLGPQRGRHRASLQHRVAWLGVRCAPRAPVAAPVNLPLWPCVTSHSSPCCVSDLPHPIPDALTCPIPALGDGGHKWCWSCFG